MVDALLRDTRHATRGLLARPTYAIVAIATLALVIGAASAVLAVVSATMVRPLPFPHGDRLVKVFSLPPGVSRVADRNPLHPRVFYRWRARQFTSIEALEGIWARERALGGDGEPESVSSAAVSSGFLSMFANGAVIGRTFTEVDTRTKANVVVISHGLWQRRFGGDLGVLGRTLQIDRDPHVIVGVMPVLFTSAYVDAEVWTPLNTDDAPIDSAATFVQAFARLKPTATVAQLMAELTPAMDAVIPEAAVLLTGWRPDAAPLRDAQFGAQRSTLLALLAGVFALTVVACANLANLTLAQVLARRSEHALRAALGGGRALIIRLQVIETALLIVVGAVAGLVLGGWMLPTLLALDPTTARTLGDVAIDWRVQALTGLVAAVVTLLAGVIPVARALGADVATGLSAATPRTAGSRRHGMVRNVLIGGEAALTTVLLVCSALLFSAFERTARIHPGFDPEGVFGAQLRISASAYPNEATRADFIGRVLSRVREVPGVIAAGTTLNPFQPGFAFVTLVKIEGKPTPDGQAHTVQFRRISPEYFRTMRIPMIGGRDFNDGDGLKTPLVAIVSRSFAERFWPGEDAIGRRLERGANPRFYTVVGVVEDVSDVGFSQAPAPTVYLTYAQSNVAITPTSLVVRTTGDPLALTNAIRAAVLSVDPAQPIDHVTTVARFLADSLGPQRFRSTLLLILSGLGVLIAAVGIYGVTSRAVGERTRELGVRLALGATPTNLLALVVRQALTAVAIGLAVGALLAGAAGMTLLSTLPGLERAESWTAVPAIALLAIVATGAAVMPARKAVAMDPTTALRT